MIAIIEKVYQFLWGDWIVLPLPGGSSFRLSLLVLILIPAGIWFTIRTRFLPIRLFPDMLHTLFEKKGKAEGESHNSTLSALQTLIVSTATRVGMGNLVGVVAAISAGGAGAVFWMWVTALIGSSTAFVEATLAQIYKEKDPVYGGYRGGPAYYMHRFIQEKRGGKKKRYVGISVLFAISGLICWCGISQVISNSVTSAFHNAFHIPPIYTTVVLVALAAVIIFRKTATVKVLDVLVPVMAGCYFLITVILICMNFSALPGVFSRIFEEAFGIRQAVAGFIDTIVICSCTAMIMLLTPESLTEGAVGMELLQAAMGYHLGQFGVIFIAATLWLFSFSTFLGILYYARSNISYLFGDGMLPQNLYKVLALVMMFIGGLAAYTVVWDLGDVGVGLMTVFNIIMLYPMSGIAMKALKSYETEKKNRKKG